MKIKYIVLLILLLVSNSSFAMTGMVWNSLDQAAKTWMVAGIFEGVNVGNDLAGMTCYGENLDQRDKAASECSHAVQARYYKANVKYMQPPIKQIRLELDAFYADPRNEAIQISSATMYIVKRLAGDPITDVYLQNIRNTANAHGK